MKLFRYFVASLVIAVTLLVATQPAYASGNVTYFVKNKTNKALELTLLGSQNYVWNIQPGRNVFSAQSGTYQLSYYACGQLNISSVTINASKNELEIRDCDGSNTFGDAIFKIKNFSEDTMRVSLLGPENYHFDIGPGNYKFEIKRGLYSYVFYHCGANQSGTFKVLDSQNEMKIYACDDNRPEYGVIEDKITTLEVKNVIDVSLTLNLRGPRDYTLDIRRTGAYWTYQIDKGSYYYTYFACGQFNDGFIDVYKQRVRLTLDPAQGCAYNWE
jgi:hypothetical protein